MSNEGHIAGQTLMWLALTQLGKLACPPGIVCPCIPCACCWRCYFEEKARWHRVEDATTVDLDVTAAVHDPNLPEQEQEARE
jgi:hypothetical protein